MVRELVRSERGEAGIDLYEHVPYNPNALRSISGPPRQILPPLVHMQNIWPRPIELVPEWNRKSVPGANRIIESRTNLTASRPGLAGGKIKFAIVGAKQ